MELAAADGAAVDHIRVRAVPPHLRPLISNSNTLDAHTHELRSPELDCFISGREMLLPGRLTVHARCRRIPRTRMLRTTFSIKKWTRSLRDVK